MNLLSASDRVLHSDPLSSSALFKQFLDERRFLHNVTPGAIEWYETAFKALQRESGQSSPLLTSPRSKVSS
jgi:hypothetical protein